MRTWSQEEWTKLLQGYDGRDATIDRMKRNMDAYVGDVGTKEYLPQYSEKEDEKDYNKRLERAENNYFNFPRKIMKIYFNAIFRSTEPARESDSEEIKRFWENVDGAGRHIQRFIKEQVFVLNRIHGGALIVCDKPPRPEPPDIPVTRQRQLEANWFPYAYVIPWEKLINFDVDRYGNLAFAVLDYGKDGDTRLYKVWDTEDWWVVDAEQAVRERGRHALGFVPIHRSYDLRNPKHGFQVPMAAMDDVVKIALKIYELMSQLDQMILGHVFLKIAMPESAYKKIQSSGMGVHNVLVYEDDYEGKDIHYVQMPSSEIEKLVELIFVHYPHMILEFASIRAKTDKPREESGVAKMVDSKDEMDNLIDMAEAMEEAEMAITHFDAAWEGVGRHQTTISYSKNFDVLSVNEQLANMVELFKQDLQSPTASKALVKRVVRKMLGNVDNSKWKEIEEEIDASIDPALDLNDLEKLINMAALSVVPIARKYDPELKDADDAAVAAKIAQNINNLRGVPAAATDGVV